MKNGNIKLVVTDEAPSRLLEQHSAARLHLAQLIDRRLGIEDNLRQLAAAAKRLREAQAAEQNAIAAIDALSAVEAAAMTEWSRNPSGPEPEPDVAKRDELQAKHRTAVARATAARQAQVTIAADQQREAAALKVLEPAILEAIVEIIIESTAPLLEDLKESQVALASKQGRLNQAVQEAITVSRQTLQDGPVGSTGAMIANLIETFRTAATPAIETSAADVAAWRSLSTRLRADPLAKLED